jgi:hypothetical protein
MREALADSVVLGGEYARAINGQFLDFKWGRQRLLARDTRGAGGGERDEGALCGRALLLGVLSVGVLSHFQVVRFFFVWRFRGSFTTRRGGQEAR